MTAHDRRIILHVGSPKCGSTYLQKVLLNNAARLEAQGCRYPHPGPGSTRSRHPGNAAHLEQLDRTRIEPLFAGNIHTVLLSHEDLYCSPQSGTALRALADKMGIALQVVAFIRPFSDFLFADYSQFMKQFFEPYLKARAPYDGLDLLGFAESRARAVPAARFLRGWARRSSSPLILASHRRIRPVFEDLLGPDVALDWTLPRGAANPSLRVEDCDAIAAAMRDAGRRDREIRQMFKAAFHATHLPDAGRSPERIAHIEALFAGENRAIQRHFGYDNRAPGSDATTDASGSTSAGSGAGAGSGDRPTR